VRDGDWKSQFAGMRGTIQKPWVSYAHAAVEILLEDGRLEFFWPPNLELVERDIAV
jgi:hypothetical protein